MRIISIAFLISLLLHLILFINFKEEKKEIETTKDKNKKTQIKYIKLQKKENKVNPKKTIEKKVTKKIKKEKKKIEKPKKITKKINPKKRKERKEKNISQKKKIRPLKKTKLKEIKPKYNKKPKSIETLEEALLKNSFIDTKTQNMIKELYGTEYEKLTKVQKAFIKNNINIFRYITQKVLDRLGYPPLAARLRIGGMNIVEFVFYPNGDIKNLRIKSSSGYKVLDDYTLQLIEIAYKDYPKPKTPTKIIFYVHYRI